MAGNNLTLLLVCLAALVVLVAAQTSSKPTPITVPPSLFWDGNDGPWSTFGLQIGSPSQNVRLLPATGSSSIWAVLPEGCIASDPSSCAGDRGLAFAKNKSTSWDEIGLYSLPLFHAKNLGYSGNAYVGRDNAILGWQNDPQIQLGKSTVAGFATKDFFTGSFGLTSRPEYVKSLNDPENSMLWTLRNQNKIPSLSWGYTAGAYWTNPKTFGSLTLGGFDRSRMVPNNITTNFAADFSLDLTIGLSSITAVSSSGNKTVMDTGIYTFIDSMVPHIWLPEAACTVIQEQFGLEYNATKRLYTIPDDAHSKNAGTSLVFNLTPSLQNNLGTVSISIPYAALALDAKYPLFSTTTRYFPLRRAMNDSQYTLGRAFLQSAYVITDYERSRFQVFQALYPDASISKDIVPILTPADAAATSTPNGPSTSNSSSSLSTGAIAGIAVGGVAVLALIVAAFFLRRRRNRHHRLHELSAENATAAASGGSRDERYKQIPGSKYELSGDETALHEIPESAAAGYKPLVSGTGERFELASPMYELEAPMAAELAIESAVVPELDSGTGANRLPLAGDNKTGQEPLEESRNGPPVPPKPDERTGRSGSFRR